MKILANTIEAIVSNVSRHAAVYAAARPNHPALASYETIADVLAALGKSSVRPASPPFSTGSAV